MKSRLQSSNIECLSEGHVGLRIIIPAYLIRIMENKPELQMQNSWESMRYLANGPSRASPGLLRCCTAKLRNFAKKSM